MMPQLVPAPVDLPNGRRVECQASSKRIRDWSCNRRVQSVQKTSAGVGRIRSFLCRLHGAIVNAREKIERRRAEQNPVERTGRLGCRCRSTKLMLGADDARSVRRAAGGSTSFCRFML